MYNTKGYRRPCKYYTHIYRKNSRYARARSRFWILLILLEIDLCNMTHANVRIIVVSNANKKIFACMEYAINCENKLYYVAPHFGS